MTNLGGQQKAPVSCRKTTAENMLWCVFYFLSFGICILMIAAITRMSICVRGEDDKICFPAF